MAGVDNGSEAAEALPARAKSRRRFVVPGEPNRRSDGSLDDGLEAQMRGAWTKLFALMRAEGYEKRDLVKATVLVTEGGNVGLFRSVRDRMLGGHTAASSYLHVEKLGASAGLVQIEGEVAKA
jgi:enamine deaminase RidA (YjgF/YER057c/UK114 family)